MRIKLSILCFIVLMGAAPASWGGVVGVVVRFEPADQTVGLGDPVTVNIVADFSSSIVGWGLDETEATPFILTTSAPLTIGPAWVAPGATVDGDGLAGLAFPDSVSSGTGILLATLSFTASAVGDTYLLASITLGDDTEGFALDPIGFAALEFEPGHVTVTPEPAVALALLMCALVAPRRRFSWQRRTR